MMKRIVAAILMLAMLLSSCTAFADSFSDMLNKAEAYQLAGDDEKALACYQLAQQLSPDQEEGFLGEAKLLLKQHDYMKAAALVSKALEIHPVSQEAWKLKCELDALNNDVASFEKDSVFAAVCEVDLSADYASIASMYANAGLFEKAVDYFQLVDLNTLDEEQKKLYRRALVLSGRRDVAEGLGLVSLAVRDSELDARFDADELRLVKAATPQIHPEDFEFSSEMWKALEVEQPADPYADLAAHWQELEFTWLSFSPSSNSGILTINGKTAAYYNGKYHLVYPSSTRGVADENENLRLYAARRIQDLIGAEGIVYSPDGRYAGIYNADYILKYFQLFIDPIMIDLSTGEMILTATYKNRLHEGNAGAVAAAAFSADGKYLYYVLYGKLSEAAYRTALFRYNLASCETEFCYSGSDSTYFPSLAETQTGSFLILRDTIQRDEMTGLSCMDHKAMEWSSREYTFDLPSSLWNCNRLLSSLNSGYALALGRVTGIPYAFQCIKPDEAFKGLNQYAVVMKGSNELKLLDAAALSAVFDNVSKTLEAYGEDKPMVDLLLPYHTIAAITLSPDGHYALLNTIAREEAASTHYLFLVRLDDMSMKEVKGVDPNDIRLGSQGAKYQPIIEWNTDTLLISTSDGVQAYQFQ